jgi:PAS domain S-box-containing protein
LLHNFFAQAPAFFAILKGPEHVFEFANPAYMELIGNRNPIGKTLFDAVPEVKGQDFIELLDNVYKTGETFTGKEKPVKVDRGNGKFEQFYLNFTYQAYKNSKGDTERILVFAYDVTELVTTRKKLEANALMIRNVYMNAPAAICTFKGPDHIYELVNPAYERLFGKRDLVGKPFLEALPELKGQGVDKILDNIYNTGEVFTSTEIPVNIARADNVVAEQRYFNTTMQPIYNEENIISGVVNFGYDVTEQIRARKQIEASEQRFRNILEQAPDPIVILKGENMILDTANEALYQLWRVDKSAIGKSFLEILPEMKGQGFLELLQDVYFNGKVIKGYDTPAEFIRKDGQKEILYFNFIHQPYRELDGSISGVLVMASDVTKQMLARKQIEESEKRFSNVLTQSVMSIGILKGTDMIINFANEMMMASWGKGNNIIGKPLLEVLPELEDQPFPKLIQEVLATGVPYYGYEEKVTLVNNGKEKVAYFNYVYQPYTEIDNRITGVTVLASEVTAQVHVKKENEEIAERFRLLADAQPQKVWTADHKGNKNYFNQQWYNYTKLTFEDLKGWGWKQIVHPDDWELKQKKWKDSIDTGKPFELEYRLLGHDGTYRWHVSRAIAQKDHRGEIIMWVGSNTDIDNQKAENQKLETKVKESTYSLEQAKIATKAKQQFLSNMSHEIRTPMNAILGFTKVLLKTDLSGKQKEYLLAIKTGGDAMIVLINDILDLAKVNEGKMAFVQTLFKMEASIGTMLHLFENNIQEKNLELVKEYDNKIPEVLLGDPARLHQILINLLSNAVKFTSKGKIKICVYLVNEDEENATIEFSVTDTGIGIAENKTEKIFENFEQALDSTSRLYGGTGLGLAIVKQLVEAQGGSISVKSKIGEGSTFSFTLSLKKSKTKAAAREEVATNNLEDRERKNIKVLVVEDMKLNQLLMRTILDEYGFENDIAENGKIAIEKLKTNSYDIILMDLQMPEMNGFEATEYIRTIMNCKTPIVALSADVTTIDAEKCQAVGMNDYLAKPIDEKDLYGKILELVKKN